MLLSFIPVVMPLVFSQTSLPRFAGEGNGESENLTNFILRGHVSHKAINWATSRRDVITSAKCPYLPSTHLAWAAEPATSHDHAPPYARLQVQSDRVHPWGRYCQQDDGKSICITEMEVPTCFHLVLGTMLFMT